MIPVSLVMSIVWVKKVRGFFDGGGASSLILAGVQVTAMRMKSLKHSFPLQNLGEKTSLICKLLPLN